MRVLIAEDERISAKLVTSYLRPYAECSLAVDGAQAIEMFYEAQKSDKPYDLVLLDIMMPGVTGQEALIAIRALESELGDTSKPAVPVIMTSALDDGPNVYHAHLEGCADYLVKPIDRASLLGVLRRMALIS